MSTKRADDMAVIEAALNQGLQVTDLSSGEPVTGLADVAPDPAPEKSEEQAKEEAEKKAKEQHELELKRQSIIKQKLKVTGQALRQAGDSTKNGLSGIKMPGGLTFPVLTLIVLFMLLVRVNGHTRLGWLWLVVTGDAAIEAGTGGGGPDLTTDTSSSNGSTEGIAKGGGPPPATFLTAYVPMELDEW